MMQNQPFKSSSLRRAAAAVPFVFLACVPAVQADTGGVGIRFGYDSDHYRAEAFWQSPTLWSHTFSGNWGRLTLDAEVGVAYWDARHDDKPGNAWQFTATPMLRWWLTPAFYIEGGVGPSFFSTTRVSGKEISTSFQFADQIGLGYRLSPQSDLSLRYSHYSNAGIKRPNPGLNALQLNYVYRF